MTIPMKCYKAECGHAWNSKSKNPFYVTCPRCYSKLNVKRARVVEESSPPTERNLRGMARRLK